MWDVRRICCENIFKCNVPCSDVVYLKHVKQMMYDIRFSFPRKLPFVRDKFNITYVLLGNRLLGLVINPWEEFRANVSSLLFLDNDVPSDNDLLLQSSEPYEVISMWGFVEDISRKRKACLDIFSLFCSWGINVFYFMLLTYRESFSL